MGVCGNHGLICRRRRHCRYCRTWQRCRKHHTQLCLHGQHQGRFVQLCRHRRMVCSQHEYDHHQLAGHLHHRDRSLAGQRTPHRTLRHKQRGRDMPELLLRGHERNTGQRRSHTGDPRPATERRGGLQTQRRPEHHRMVPEPRGGGDPHTHGRHGNRL